MKNITVLTVLVIIFYALAPVYSAYGQKAAQREYGFSISPQAGFVYGQALEFVYPVSGQTKGKLLSELIWDMKPVFYLGLQFDFEKKNLMSSPGFFSSFSIKAGIPSDSGIMEDRDWESHLNAELTKFSSHTNHTTQFFSSDVIIGVSLPVKSLFYIKPFISGSWMRFAFTGRDGYKRYARPIINGYSYHPIDDNPVIDDFSGVVIRYEQNWFLAAVGFSVGTKLLSPFSFALSFKISPFTYCAAVDNHLLGDTEFKDYTSWGLFLEPSVSLSYSFKRLEHSLEFSYRHIGKTSGATYIDKGNTGFYRSPNKGGAGLSFVDLRYLLKIHF